MIRLAYGAWCVLLAAIAAATLVPSEHPPHAAPPVAAVPQYAGQVFPDLLGQVEAFVGWVEGVRRGEAEEAARVEAARVAAARQPASSGVVSAGGHEQCDGIAWAIPVDIVWRESRCNFGAVNPTGCGGYSCVGAYQFDLRHWISRDQGGWGACADLGDWTIPENQHECASRMSLSAWGY